MIILPIYMMNTAFSSQFLGGFLLILGLVSALWIVSLIIKDASIVDIYWGLGFVAVAWFYAYKNLENFTLVHQLFLGMVTLWGFRLGGYLASRNLGKGEDYRYVQFRKEGGKHWWWISFLRVFFLQGVLQWIVSSIFLLVVLSTAELSWLHYLGLVLFAIGLFFEAVGDWQLTQFKKNPENKGKVLDTGLWRYTRHPNYFGDAMIWWGFFCFAATHPQGIYFIFAPLLMTFLLIRVSGVAMLERGLKNTKPKYAEYIRKTSAFIPMPPKA